MKIAVCISGLIRYWEETAPLFEHWNKMFPNTFVFFLSTWKGEKWIEEEKFGKIELKDYDYTQYKFITDFSLHEESVVRSRLDEKTNIIPNSYLRAYSMKQVQILRKNYEQKHNMIFDGVFQIRNDLFISKVLVQSAIHCCSSKSEATKIFQSGKIVLNPGGCTMSLENKINPVLFLGNDNFSFTSSNAMDKIMNLYDWMMEDKLFTKSCHKAPAEFYMKNDIHSLTMPGGFPFLFREGKLQKQHRPTPQGMRELIDTKGVKWIYDLPVHILEQEYWNYE